MECFDTLTATLHSGPVPFLSGALPQGDAKLYCISVQSAACYFGYIAIVFSSSDLAQWFKLVEIEETLEVKGETNTKGMCCYDVVWIVSVLFNLDYCQPLKPLETEFKWLGYRVNYPIK